MRVRDRCYVVVRSCTTDVLRRRLGPLHICGLSLHVGCLELVQLRAWFFCSAWAREPRGRGGARRPRARAARSRVGSRFAFGVSYLVFLAHFAHRIANDKSCNLEPYFSYARHGNARERAAITGPRMAPWRPGRPQRDRRATQSSLGATRGRRPHNRYTDAGPQSVTSYGSHGGSTPPHDLPQAPNVTPHPTHPSARDGAPRPTPGTLSMLPLGRNRTSARHVASPDGVASALWRRHGGASATRTPARAARRGACEWWVAQGQGAGSESSPAGTLGRVTGRPRACKRSGPCEALTSRGAAYWPRVRSRSRPTALAAWPGRSAVSSMPLRAARWRL